MAERVVFYIDCDICCEVLDFRDWTESTVLQRARDIGWEVSNDGLKATCNYCLETIEDLRDEEDINE